MNQTWENDQKNLFPAQFWPILPKPAPHPFPSSTPIYLRVLPLLDLTHCQKPSFVCSFKKNIQSKPKKMANNLILGLI